jgi:hypothetical protein
MPFREHAVKMLEGSEVAAVKGDEDCHYLAGRQSPSTLTAPLTGSQHPLPKERLRHPTEVVQFTKQRFPIHGILSSLVSLPMTTWGEYLFSFRNVIPNSGFYLDCLCYRR